MLSGEPRPGNPKSRKTKPDGATLGLLPYPIPRSPDASEAADERALQGCYIKQKRSSVFAVALALDKVFILAHSAPYRHSAWHPSLTRYSSPLRNCPIRLVSLRPSLSYYCRFLLQMHLTHLQLRL